MKSGLMEQQGEQASPQEEKERLALANAAATLVHHKQTSDMIFKMLKRADDPATGVGKTAAWIMVRIEREAGQISDAVRWQLAEDIIEELLELAESAGLAKNVDDAFIERAIAAGMKYYMQLVESSGGDAKALSQKILAENPDVAQGINALSNEDAATAKNFLGMMGG